MRDGPFIKWLVAAAALAQILGAWWPAGAGIGRTVAAHSALVTTPVTPAGYAFAIWGVIFAAAMVFAVYQLIARNEAPVREVRAPFALACFADTVWEIYVQVRGIDLVSVVIILVGLAAAVSALAAAGRGPERRWSRSGLMVFAATGLLAGWLSVAAFANIAAVLKAVGWVGPDAEPVAASVIIGLAAITAAGVAWQSRGRPWVALAAAWGLAAVIARNLEPGGTQFAIAAAAAGIVLVLVATIGSEVLARARRAA